MTCPDRAYEVQLCVRAGATKFRAPQAAVQVLSLFGDSAGIIAFQRDVSAFLAAHILFRPDLSTAGCQGGCCELVDQHDRGLWLSAAPTKELEQWFRVLGFGW